MRTLPPAIMPALAVRLAIERGFQFPDRRIRRMTERANAVIAFSQDHLSERPALQPS
jgi:hypothetical protein